MLNKYLIKNDEKIAYRVIDEETLIINLEESTFHSLDLVGNLIWHEANGKNSIEQIINVVSQEFEVDKETVTHDCIEFINDLIKKDLAYLSSNPVRD